jgi:hypothetical protein
LTPWSMVILIAFAPLLIVRLSIMREIPAPGAALSSSHAVESALTPFTIQPNFPGVGVVTVLPMR